MTLGKTHPSCKYRPVNTFCKYSLSSITWQTQSMWESSKVKPWLDNNRNLQLAVLTVWHWNAQEVAWTGNWVNATIMQILTLVTFLVSPPPHPPKKKKSQRHSQLARDGLTLMINIMFPRKSKIQLTVFTILRPMWPSITQRSTKLAWMYKAQQSWSSCKNWNLLVEEVSGEGQHFAADSMPSKTLSMHRLVISHALKMSTLFIYYSDEAYKYTFYPHDHFLKENSCTCIATQGQ